jgi:hypothetical protein
LQIKIKFFGKDHIQYANTLHSLCGILVKLEEFEKAKEGY